MHYTGRCSRYHRYKWPISGVIHGGGDIYASQPWSDHLRRIWYRNKMNYIVVTSTFYKNKHTYCRNNVTSYIGHVYFSKYASVNILSIICNISDIVSDHFPLKITISIDMNFRYNVDNGNDSRFVTRYPHIDWSDSKLGNLVYID